MNELTASIEDNGLLNPIIVRSKADGRYELISSHRRKRAYEILKINKIRAIIVDITDDETIIIMVDIIDGTEALQSFSQTVRMRKVFKDGDI